MNEAKDLHIKRPIKEFKVINYAELATFYAAARPAYRKTEAELKNEDEGRDAKLDFARFVVWQDKQIVGVASHTQLTYMYHPQKFVLELDVHPDYRKQGLGSAMLSYLETALRPFDPLVLRTQTQENRPDALRFLDKHGFVEEGRDWESHLDPNALDETKYESLFEKLAKLDICILTLEELAKIDSKYREKLYALECETDKDTPLPEPGTQPDFEAWQKMFLDAPYFLYEAQLVAVKNDEFIGMNGLFPSEAEEGCAYNGFTGVKRAYRRKGVALALKVQNLSWAKKNGFTKVKTWNDMSNRGMLAINESLGFAKEPAWIYVKKELTKT